MLLHGVHPCLPPRLSSFDLHTRQPTNHLDADSVAWLEAFLRDYKGTVIAVTVR